VFHTSHENQKLKVCTKGCEGFLLGYGTNEHTYHVINKTTGCVEVTVDVNFDESNGSQVEQVDKNLVDEEEPQVYQS
jgi:hypothetical protein